MQQAGGGAYFKDPTKITAELLKTLNGDDWLIAKLLFELSRKDPKTLAVELCNQTDPCKPTPGNVDAARARLGQALIAQRMRKGPSNFLWAFNPKTNRFTVQGGKTGDIIDITEDSLFNSGSASLKTVLIGDDLELATALARIGAGGPGNTQAIDDKELQRLDDALLAGNILINKFKSEYPNSVFDFDVDILRARFKVRVWSEGPRTGAIPQWEWVVGPYNGAGPQIDLLNGLASITIMPPALLKRLLCYLGKFYSGSGCQDAKPSPDDLAVVARIIAGNHLRRFDGRDPENGVFGDVEYRLSNGEFQVGRKGSPDSFRPLDQIKSLGVCVSPIDDELIGKLKSLKELSTNDPAALARLRCELQSQSCFDAQLPSGGANAALNEAGSLLVLIHQRGLATLTPLPKIYGREANFWTIGMYEYWYDASINNWKIRQVRDKDGKVIPPASLGQFVQLEGFNLPAGEEGTREAKLIKALQKLAEMRDKDPRALAAMLCALRQYWQRISVIREQLFALYYSMQGRINDLQKVCNDCATAMCEFAKKCAAESQWVQLVMWATDVNEAIREEYRKAAVVGELAKPLREALAAVMLMDETFEYKIAQLPMVMRGMKALFEAAGKPNVGLEAFAQNADTVHKNLNDARSLFRLAASFVPGGETVADAVETATGALTGDEEALKRFNAFVEKVKKNPEDIAIDKVLSEVLNKVIKNPALREIVKSLLSDKEFRDEILNLVRTGDCNNLDQKFKMLLVKFILKKLRAPQFVQKNPELAEAFANTLFEDGGELLKTFTNFSDKTAVLDKLREMLITALVKWLSAKDPFKAIIEGDPQLQTDLKKFLEDLIPKISGEKNEGNTDQSEDLLPKLIEIFKKLIAGKLAGLLGNNPNIAGVLGSTEDIRAAIAAVLDGFNITDLNNINWNDLFKKVFIQLLAGRLGISEAEAQALLQGDISGLEIGNVDVSKVVDELNKIASNPTIQKVIIAAPAIGIALVPVIKAILARLKFRSPGGRRVYLEKPVPEKKSTTTPGSKVPQPCSLPGPIKFTEDPSSCGIRFTVVLHESAESLKAEFVKEETNGNTTPDKCDLAKRQAENLKFFVDVPAGKIHLVKPAANLTAEELGKYYIQLALLVDDLMAAKENIGIEDRFLTVACFLCNKGYRLVLSKAGKWELYVMSDKEKNSLCKDNREKIKLRNWRSIFGDYRSMVFVTKRPEELGDLTVECKVNTGLKKLSACPECQDFLRTAGNVAGLTALPDATVRDISSGLICPSSLEVNACIFLCIRAKVLGKSRVFLVPSPISYEFSGKYNAALNPPIEWGWVTSLGPIGIGKDVEDGFAILDGVPNAQCNDDLKDKDTHKAVAGWENVKIPAQGKPLLLGPASPPPPACPANPLDLKNLRPVADTKSAITTPQLCNSAWKAPDQCLCANILISKAPPAGTKPVHCACITVADATNDLREHIAGDIVPGEGDAATGKIPRLNGGGHDLKRITEWLTQLLDENQFGNYQVKHNGANTTARAGLLDHFDVDAASRAQIKTGKDLLDYLKNKAPPKKATFHAAGGIAIQFPEFVFTPKAYDSAKGADLKAAPPGHPLHGYPNGGKGIFPDGYDWDAAKKACLDDFKNRCDTIGATTKWPATGLGPKELILTTGQRGANLYCLHKGLRIVISINGTKTGVSVGSVYPAWVQ